MSAIVAPTTVPTMSALVHRALFHRKTALRLGAMLAIGFVPLYGPVLIAGWMGRTARHIRMGRAGLPEVRLGHDIWSAGLIQIGVLATNVVFCIPLVAWSLLIKALGWGSTLAVLATFGLIAAVDPSSTDWSTDLGTVMSQMIIGFTALITAIPAYVLTFEATRMATMGEVMAVRRAKDIVQGVNQHRLLFSTLMVALGLLTFLSLGAVSVAAYHSLWALLALPAALLFTSLANAVAIAHWDFVVGDGPDFE